MAEFKQISPLLDHMTVLSSLGSHDGSTCYLVKHDSLEKTFVLKLISIPQSEEKTTALLLAGAFADEAAANEYYAHLAEDLKQELDTIIKLGDSPNIAPVLGYQVEPKESRIGYDVYILTEHWQSLASFAADNAMTNLRAVNLGIDICNALCTLRQSNLLSQNIKPENIYSDGQGHFLLGDLGIASMEYLQFSSLSEQYRSVYTPPEFSDMMANLNPTMDTYSLGMLLYRIYNGNHGPFEDEKTSAAAAESRRLAGENLPPAMYADYEIAAIILKACAPKQADRFQTPDAMRQALMFYMQRNNITDDLIVPPIVVDPEPPMASHEADEPVEPVSFTDVKELDETFVQSFSPSIAPVEAPQAEESEKPPEDPTPPPEPEPPQEAEAPQEVDPPQETKPPEEPETPPETEAPEEAAPPKEAEPAAEAEPPQEAPAVPQEATQPDAPEQAPAAPDNPKPSKKSKSDDAKKAPDKPKKKKPVALLSVAAVLLVLLIGAYVFFSQWYYLDVDAISLTEKTADSIVVTVDSPALSKLTITCYDGLSHTYTAQMDGKQATFTGLSSNTKYTVAAVAPSGHKLSHSSTESIDVTTCETTDVKMSLHAAELTGQADLTVSVESGPVPDKYVLRYVCDGEQERTKEFTGDTYRITDLTVGKDYTFTLLDHDTYYMAGEPEAKFTIFTPATVENLHVQSVRDGQLDIAWDCTENDPGEWTVRCEGDDGYDETLDVSACAASFTGTALFANYTVTLTSPALAAPMTLSVPANSISVENLTATAQDGQIAVHWDAPAGTPEGGWKLEWRIASLDQEPTVVSLDTNDYTLPGVIGNATYEFTVKSGGAQATIGDATATVLTGDAPAFDRYAIRRSVVGPGLFSVPDKDDWTWRDLAQAHTSFASGETVVCVLQSDVTPEDSDATVTLTTAIRDAEGNPVALTQSESAWNDLWSDLRFVCQVTAPEAAGDYTIEIYIDGALLYTIDLTVA